MKRSPLIILFVTLFIDLLGFGLILPLIPVYILHYGGSSAIGGLLMASFSIAQFLFAPLWGRASDRYGRRPIILISLSGSALSYFFFGAAGSLAVLFAARVASGILTSASLPTAQAYIADVTPPDKRAGGMAMLGAAFGLGFAFGPWIGGVLGRYSLFGLPAVATPAYFAAGLALLNWIWAFFALPESFPPEEREKAKAESADGKRHGEQGLLNLFPVLARALQNPAFKAQLTVFAFVTFAFTAVESSFSWLVLLRFKQALTSMAAQAWQQAHPMIPFASLPPLEQQHLMEKAATGETSTIFGIVGITILFTQGAVMGGLARRVGEHRLVKFGCWLLTCTLLGIALAPNLLLIRILSACIAIGNGLMSPSLTAMITHAAGPADRGTISGAQQGLGSLSRIIAPPINNYLVGLNTTVLGLTAAIPFLSSAVLMTIAFLLSLRLGPLVHAEAPKQPSDVSDTPTAAPEPAAQGVTD